MRGYIYVLKDQFGVIFYVGATIYPEYRLSGHLSVLRHRINAYTPPLYQYMRENGIIPNMEILEARNYRTRENMLKSEGKWIKRLQKEVYLVNICGKNKDVLLKLDTVFVESDVFEEAKTICLRPGTTIEEYVTEAVREKNQREK